MTAISGPWASVFGWLVAAGAQPERLTPEGGWDISVDCVDSSVGKVLARLPGEYARIHQSWEEMIDHSGECVDFETESGAFACDAERAIFEYVDHWQAGLSGSVTLYATDAAYRAAKAAAQAAYDADATDSPLNSRPPMPKRTRGSR